MTYCRSVAGHEDEGTEVGGALVAEGAGGIDERTHAIGLETRPDERSAPSNGGTGGLLGAEELLLGVSVLGALVGLAEERRENRELSGVVEDGAEGDGRGLDGGEIWNMVSVWRDGA